VQGRQAMLASLPFRYLRPTVKLINSVQNEIIGAFGGFYLEMCVFMFKRVFFLFERCQNKETYFIICVIYSTDLEM